jgi:putative transposase
MSRYKVAKLMKEAGVWVRSKKKYKVTTNSDHKQPVFDNLLKREFDVAHPDQVYVAASPMFGHRKVGYTLLW